MTSTQKAFAWIGGLLLGGLAIGGVAYAATSKPASSPPKGLTPAPTSATTTLSVPIDASTPNVSKGAHLGDIITISLPNNAAWAAGGMNPQTGNAPISWNYAGPGSVTLSWVDVNDKPQMTVLNFVTLPS